MIFQRLIKALSLFLAAAGVGIVFCITKSDAAALAAFLSAISTAVYVSLQQ